MGLLFKLAAWIASLLTARQAYALSGWISRRLKQSKTAEVIDINLRTCMPQLLEHRRERLVVERLHHMVYLFFEFAQLRFWSLDRLLAHVEVEGEDVLRESFDAERGILLLVPHFGNWELLSVYLGHHFTVSALYDPPKQGGLEAQIVQARERFAGRMFPIGVAGMRSVFKELRGGGLVAVLPDQVPTFEGGEYVPFFGRPALTMTLPRTLQERTACDVIFAAARRSVDSKQPRYCLSFTRLDDADLEIMNTHIQQLAETFPEQYQWEYKRFRRPPEGGKQNIYRRQ